MYEFTPVTTEEVSKLVMSSSKSCSLDTIPLSLFKENIKILAKPLTSIINKSISSGIFPTKLKKAIVTPVLKKANLDKEVFKNYRPVSNISYVSKIMEKIVCAQIKEHLQTNGLQEKFQSAYKACHSTETALLRVKTDILNAMEDNKAVAIVLLDLSAAFDTVDHGILLDQLHNTFKIQGTALKWISSYLQNRSFCVGVGDVFSKTQPLPFGLPQGSVVGPLFFIIYTYYIGSILRKHNITYHIYADDVQLYLPFNPKVDGDAEKAVGRLSACIDEISEWMNVNKLKLNNDKTEFFVAASPRIISHLHDISIKIGTNNIPRSSTIKNLGVVFDQTMSMTEHVKSIIKSVNFHLRNIYRIRRFITADSCHHLVRSLILSRIDYANSLLYGISAKNRKKLQTLQNRAARIVFKSDRRQPSTPLLKELHWLPVRERIVFKLMLLTFKGMHAYLPSYLSEYLIRYTSGRANLRSGDDHTLLAIPRTKRVAGDKAFCNAAPSLWNSLPTSVRQCMSIVSFKKSLKFHLFPKD